MACEEAGQNEAIPNLAKAFGGAADEFVRVGSIVGKDAAGPEGVILDGGLKEIHAGLRDSDLGRVIDAEGDRQGEREEDHLVGGALLEIECGGSRDVSHREGRTGAVAGRDLCGGGVDEARKGARDFDWHILRTEEPGVIAAMPNEELVLEAGVGVRKGTALRLEDGLDALVRSDDVEPRKEVVVCQGNDALRGREELFETGIERRGVGALRFVKSDERGGRGDPSGCRGEPGGIGDCRGEEQEGCLHQCRVCKEMLPGQRVGGTAGASSRVTPDVVGSTSRRKIESHPVVGTSVLMD